ncbi:hypothetical protein KY290_009617 [Solanum tuberosum]|uniref:AMP-activated protein kinase glycogen-binding domain-containing protein n=1 Tax=Solanum tuberosum TaxID=4113 RepID=A0ABQ7VVD1_SOLTU|nr:hypothetical protein KY284_009539 [Solanum tuberosum]KAH0772480.1 hypothetical protein KY290_009617 [Solanum tuberosum]
MVVITLLSKDLGTTGHQGKLWPLIQEKILQRSGKDYTVLLVLPSGIYHYKFIVDGEVRYIPELPCVADETGVVFNLLDVNVSENSAS